MKNVLAFCVLLGFALQLAAQPSEPVKLAILAESADAADASDLLTAALSSNPKLHLLERDQINKVYQEQALSAQNLNLLKLGQILGADGLLILDVSKPANAVALPFAPRVRSFDLTARLIAVKPGVVLSAEQITVSSDSLQEWSDFYAKHLQPLLPKLSLLAKDAIPISVVNLRCAAQSDAAPEVERQLKLLTIERLSREPRFFVLERERMQSLAEEKALKLDESAFWNGSYLLEAVVDQNGYNKDTITLTARLTPPKGAAPLPMEVSGSRADFSGLVNQLAAKVNESLKISATSPAWNPAAEAAQYYDEAQWALKWGIYPEAQAAVESAWALGKRDLQSAALRVQAYLREVPDVLPPGSGRFVRGKKDRYVNINETPDPKYCDTALYALRIYYQFTQASPPGKIQWLPRSRSDINWYSLGVSAMNTASGILRHFDYVPSAKTAVSDKLAELRAATRSVADLISSSSIVNDSYHEGDDYSLWECEIDWGRYWQEKPEDTLALYRRLMDKPVFQRMYWHLCAPPDGRPRLIGWNENDRRRLPAVWNNFLGELGASTNILWRWEEKALNYTAATNTQQQDAAFTKMMDLLVENRFALRDIEVNWFGGHDGGRFRMHLDPRSANRLRQEYGPKVAAKDDECEKIIAENERQRLLSIKENKHLQEFEAQKQFLRTNCPYEPNLFCHTFDFSFRDYSKAQALEIRPLFASYKSNLIEMQAKTNQWTKIAVRDMDRMEDDLNGILNPAPTPPPAQTSPLAQTPHPMPAPQPIASSPAPSPAPASAAEPVSTILTVNRFTAIPANILQRFKPTNSDFGGFAVSGHHWVEGKLVLDLQYGLFVYSFNAQGKWQGTRNVSCPGVAVLDPGTGHWDVAGADETDSVANNPFYHHTTLWHGQIVTCNSGQTKKYDLNSRKWITLPVSDGDNHGLFNVGGHLYAADMTQIFEILDNGNSTRLLASSRRRPPVSVLDTQDLGRPVLFEGPGHSLRLAIPGGFYTWTNNDWRKFADAPTALPPSICEDAILFLAFGNDRGTTSLIRLTAEGNAPELCLAQNSFDPHRPNYSPSANSQPYTGPGPQHPYFYSRPNATAAPSSAPA